MGKGTERNFPCACGSGKKFKHCCLRKQETISRARTHFRQQAVKSAIHEEKFGKILPVVHADFNGYKVVGVGNQLHFSKQWKTFPDFLYEYVKMSFGKSWWMSEAAKPGVERHYVLKWAKDNSDRSEQGGEVVDAKKGIFSLSQTSQGYAYILLGYDLYVLRHYAALQNSLLRRLRHADQFLGARYELYVAATFIRAGFEITFEDEKDGSRKHPEFIAVHKTTGQRFCVEAKRRHRAPGKDSIRLGVTNLLRKALEKYDQRNFIIFVEMDVLPIEGDPMQQPWTKELLESPSIAGGRNENGTDRFNMIVFTNQPVLGPKEQAYGQTHFFTVTKVPEIPVQHPLALDSVIRSVQQSGKVPNDFSD